MKLYINRDQIRRPWGGGAWFVNACYDHVAQHDINIVSLSMRPDVVLLAGLDSEGNGISAEHAVAYKIMMNAQGRDVKIVLRVNENDARKGTSNVDARLLNLMQSVDAVVFVSSWLQGYFAKKGFTGRSTVITNGVDTTSFKPGKKLDNGSLNIVTHHWSNNPMKGFDVYETLDRFVSARPGYTFTYIGRHRNTFKNTKVIDPLYGKELGETLGTYDVYVSGSRWDPGPNHVLESLSCGLPTFVHVDGGGAVEFAGQDFAYSSMDQLLSMFEDVAAKNVMNAQTFVKPWERCVAEYSQMMKAL